MEKETIAVLVIAGLTLFVWVPAIFFSVRKALRETFPNEFFRRNKRNNNK